MLLPLLIAAQDPSLPQGGCELVLKSGKTISEVKLWRLYQDKLEYASRGSLHDIPFAELNYLRIGSALWRCRDSARIVKMRYDWILPYNDDTIYCIIRRVKPGTLVYQLPGSPVYHSIERCYVIRFGLDEQEQAGDARPRQAQNTPPTQVPVPKEAPVVGQKVAPLAQQSDARAPVRVDFYEMGKTDGWNDFKGNGSFCGGLICGAIPVFGWITGVTSLAVTPNPNPKNVSLYQTNSEYRKGYRKGMRHKKSAKTMAGMLTGTLTLFFVFTL
jgi:hypothetical protein